MRGTKTVQERMSEATRIQETDSMLKQIEQLQAECERLKAELAQVRAQNKSLLRFGQDDPEMAFDDELGWMHKDSLTIVNELRADNARLRALAGEGKS